MGTIGAWILSQLEKWLVMELLRAVGSWLAGFKMKKTEKKTEEKLAEDTKKGDLDAMAKDGENLLNGNPSK